MADTLRYRCTCCGEVHEGLPAWHFDAPVQVHGVPASERDGRVERTSDGCVITRKDGSHEFYAKGLLELPVRGVTEPFVFGVWLSLSKDSFARYAELFDDPQREAGAEFFGWLCNSVPGYPDTQLLKTMVHVREYPMRPWVELEPTDHPLAIDQRVGLTREQAVAMAERLLHPGR